MASEFIQFLVKKKLIPENLLSSLELESKESKKTVDEIITEKGIISEKDFFHLKSNFLNIPIKKVTPEQISSDVLKEIPEETARNYQIVPIDITKNVLSVGTPFPENFEARSALDFIAKQRKFKLEIFLMTFTDINELLKRYNILKEEVSEAIKEIEKEEKEEKEGIIVKVKKRKEETERIVSEAPVSKIVSVTLRHAVEGKASDIHIEPIGEKLRIRFRVDGILYSSLFMEKKLLPSIVSRIKILANLRIDETRKPQDGRFTSQISGKRIDFRVATLPTAQGEKVVLRILDSTTAVITKKLSALGFIGRNLRILKEGMKLPFGSIIFCGPTGSGKSTSQYTILQNLNKEAVNIVTLEDPVEYWIDGVNQSQVRPEIGYSFAQGLRQIVRQDPDIIMVGEVRDKETADLVTHAALTGHLVLFTLHTNNAVGAIPRMIDLGVEPFLIPPTIKIVVSQRLVRKLCNECKKKVKANKEQEKIIRQEIEKIPQKERKDIKISLEETDLYQSVGCPSCANKGTKGRIGIFEIFIMTDKAAEVILKDSSEQKIEEESTRQGMITMKQDGIIKALKGLVSFEEVLKVVEVQEKII
ncbi:MAG: GspE/PulE family protein [Candidatus Pacebacteria bacterium]|nr:GspE/PulE family protein [Candidatus Paceibacterota bacterium]